MAEVTDRSLNPMIVLSIILLVFSTLTMIRYVFFVFTAWSLAFGVGMALLLIKSFKTIPNCLLLLTLGKVSKKLKMSVREKKPSCAVCSKNGCSRHRIEKASMVSKLLGSIKVPKPVDEALTEFYEIVLRTHIYSWYWDLSHDQGLVDEVRTMLTYFTTVIVDRVKKKDIPCFVLKNCLKKFMIQLDCYFRTKERVSTSTGENIQQAVFDSMRSYKHFCLQNDVAELEYLRYTMHTLLPLLLPNDLKHAKCSSLIIEEICSNTILKPLIEKLAEPDIINQLLLILLDKSTLPEPDYPASAPVVLLDSFRTARSHNISSPLEVSSYDVMHHPAYLYPMMQFMKREGPLNLLQFCLAVEEFNQKSLAMDLSEKEQVQLLDQAKEINDLYFDTNAVDKIGFPEDVVEEFHQAINSPRDAKTQLRTASSLFKAFEYASDLLEKKYTPLFHKSEEFFELICGERAPKSNKSTESNLEKRKFMPLAELSKLASKIRAKKMIRNEASFYGLDGPIEASFDSGDNDEIDDDESDDETYDLSYWHVTLPRVDFVLDNNKKSFVFIINVERVGANTDLEETDWQVVRKYNEFYVLDTKLRRFHDCLNNAELPAKRTILKKDFDYLSSIRLKLQEYLQRLVRSPVLRVSSLLHSFLTPGAEITGMFEPESVGRGAGRKMKSLKSKLVTEKGQNLELFLNSFISTAEPPIKKRISSKPPNPPSGHKRHDSRMYLPPPAWARDHKRRFSSSTSLSNSFHPCGLTNYILYAARNFLKVPSWVHHVLVGVRFLGKNTIDAFVERYMAYKLSLAMAEKQLVSYIHLVRDLIFFDTDPPRTDTDKLERRDKTLEEMLQLLPEQVRGAIGKENHDYAIKTTFEMLQCPRLNKQLIYVLLDEILYELFPELSQGQMQS